MKTTTKRLSKSRDTMHTMTVTIRFSPKQRSFIPHKRDMEQWIEDYVEHKQDMALREALAQSPRYQDLTQRLAMLAGSGK